MVSLRETFDLLLDMPPYRRLLSDLVFDFWMRLVKENKEGFDGPIIWKLLGDEVVLRSVENDIDVLFTPVEENGPSPQAVTIHQAMVAMISVAGYCDCTEEDDFATRTADAASPLSPPGPVTPINTVSSPVSPVATRSATESPVVTKDKDSGVQQQLMPPLTFATTGGTRQSQNPAQQIGSPDDNQVLSVPRTEPSPTTFSEKPTPLCRGNIAIVALINVFSQLAFIDSVMTERQASLAIYVFSQLLKLLRTAQCPKTRLIILQALLRLRADRDQRVYLKSDPSENESQIVTLASLIERNRDSGGVSQ